MVGEGDEHKARPRAGRAENAAIDLVDGISGRVQDYISEAIASFDAAINGEYDAQRLVADASRMTTRMVRDAAELLVTGFDVLNILAGMQERGGGQPPAKAEPRP
jgi:hypothetical protein